jgi:hypothetical protein
MTETKILADHVLPVARAVVESHESELIAPSIDVPPRLLLDIRTLVTLIESAESVAQAIRENNEKIPKNILYAIAEVQIRFSTKMVKLLEAIKIDDVLQTPAETSVSLPTGHRLPTNLDRHDQ